MIFSGSVSSGLPVILESAQYALINPFPLTPATVDSVVCLRETSPIQGQLPPILIPSIGDFFLPHTVHFQYLKESSEMNNFVRAYIFGEHPVV